MFFFFFLGFVLLTWFCLPGILTIVLAIFLTVLVFWTESVDLLLWTILSQIFSTFYLLYRTVYLIFEVFQFFCVLILVRSFSWYNFSVVMRWIGFNTGESLLFVREEITFAADPSIFWAKANTATVSSFCVYSSSIPSHSWSENQYDCHIKHYDAYTSELAKTFQGN